MGSVLQILWPTWGTLVSSKYVIQRSHSCLASTTSSA